MVAGKPVANKSKNYLNVEYGYYARYPRRLVSDRTTKNEADKGKIGWP